MDLSLLTTLVNLEYLAVVNFRAWTTSRPFPHLVGIHTLSCLPTLQKLDLTGCFGLSMDEFKSIGKLTQLRELVLVGCHSLPLFECALHSLKGLTLLKKLHLRDTWLIGKQLSPLRLLPSLTWLDMSDNKLTGDEFRELAQIPALQVLRIDKCDYFPNMVDWFRKVRPCVNLDTVHASVWFRARNWPLM